MLLFNPSNFPYYKLHVPKHLRKEWEEQLWASIRTEAKAYFTVFHACRKKNVVIRDRTDRVKKIDNKQHTMPREYLGGKYRKLNTHDNAADEGFWGVFIYEDVPIKEYQESEWKRYNARRYWLQRNLAYGYLYEDFGVEDLGKPLELYEYGKKDSGETWIKIEIFANCFLYQAQIADGKGGYKSYKFGHKAHRSAPIIEATGKKNRMYANRIVVFKTKKYND